MKTEKQHRIQPADPAATRMVDEPAKPFVNNPADPSVRRLLELGIPPERLEAAAWKPADNRE